MLTYNATLSACGKGTQWQRAIQLIDEFPRGIQTDEVTYNTVIDACGKGGHWTGGLSLLASMTQCVPSTITYTSAAIACARALQWQWPLALLSEMEHRSVSPNDVTLGVLISSCNETRQWMHSLRLCAVAENQRLVGPWVNKAMIEAYLQASHWSRALWHLVDRERHGFSQHRHLYSECADVCVLAQR